MGLIPEEKVEEIKSRADIVEVVSDFVTLRKAGRNYVGLCPFHQEKTPSFTVNPEKQIFHCFGCGEGGNAVTFLMKVNAMTYPEALRHLAGKMGIQIPRKPPPPGENRGLRSAILDMNEKAAAFFTGNLQSPGGMDARKYLERRGIREETRKAFRLGFARNEWTGLRKALEREGVSLDVAKQAGLLLSREDGGSYDRFRGRVMFPIEDASGRVIAFGGRMIGDGEPKYLNSPETAVFIKGRNLFGIRQAKETIRRKSCAVLVEGYFDVISLWNAGVRNALASLGTALTSDQVHLLKRYTRDVAVIFDSDPAGRKALDRSLELFLAADVEARAVFLPDGADPDDFVRASGAEALEELVQRSPTFMDYYLETLAGSGSTVSARTAAAQGAVAMLAKVDDPIKRNLLLKRVSEKTGLDQSVLKRQVGKTVGTRETTVSGGNPKDPRPESDPLELNLVLLMIEHPFRIPDVIGSGVLDHFADGALHAFAETLSNAFSRDGRIDVATLAMEIPEEGVRQNILKSLVQKQPLDETLVERFLRDSIGQIHRKWFRRQHEQLRQRLLGAQERQDGVLCEALLREKERLLNMERNLRKGI
ncbi:MAG TPA: DNA primase [Syntrophales bacterium]|nr:DNA primase [Syntrophales bacterium]